MPLFNLVILISNRLGGFTRSCVKFRLYIYIHKIITPCIKKYRKLCRKIASIFLLKKFNFPDFFLIQNFRKMITYEITAKVRADLVEQYEKYMREIHIPDLMETKFFSGAKFTRSSENRYRIQYEAHDENALDAYLRTDATRLREDFLVHFSDGVEISRENWEVLQTFELYS